MSYGIDKAVVLLTPAQLPHEEDRVHHHARNEQRKKDNPKNSNNPSPPVKMIHPTLSAIATATRPMPRQRKNTIVPRRLEMRIVFLRTDFTALAAACLSDHNGRGIHSVSRTSLAGRHQNGISLDKTGVWLVRMESWRLRTRHNIFHELRPTSGSHYSPTLKRSESEPATDRRGKVVIGAIRNAGAMRNGDGQTAGHPGIRNPGKSIEALREVMIDVERSLIEGARARTAETG